MEDDARTAAAIAESRRPALVAADWADPYDFSARREWIQLCFLLLITAIAYTPIVSAQFLWRDDQTIMQNQSVHSLHAVGHSWLHPRSVPLYRPLADTLIALEYTLWGSWNPTGYHIISLALHLLATTLLWRVLRKLQIPAAMVGAGLFALHPIAVHAVAWASQQPVLLASVFSLASVLAWLRWNDPLPNAIMSGGDDATDRGRFVIAVTTLMLFIASMLCAAPTACAVPLALALLVGWKHLDGRGVIALGAISLTMTALVLWAGWPWTLSPSVLAHAVIGHLSRVIVPYPLLLAYSPAGSPGTAAAWIVIIVSATALALIVVRRGQLPRRGIIGARICLILLLPPIALSSWIVDSQQYLARAALLAMLAAAITPLIPDREEGDDAGHRFTRPIVATILLLLLAGGTWWQTLLCRNSETAWAHVLAYEPDSRLARLELGNDSLARNEPAAAIEQFQRLASRDPNDADAQLRLGEVLLDQGQLDEAIAHFQKCAELRPSDGAVWRHLAAAAGRKDDLAAATADYEKALALDPRDAIARNNLATLYVRQGQIDRAIATYEQVLRDNPRNAVAHVNLARLLFDTGKPQESAEHLKQAVAIDPQNFDAYMTAGDVLMKLKDFHQAQLMFRQAVHLKRDNAAALNALGVSHAAQGQWNEAIYQFGRALDVDPNYAPAKRNLDAARRDRDAAATQGSQ